MPEVQAIMVEPMPVKDIATRDHWDATYARDDRVPAFGDTRPHRVLYDFMARQLAPSEGQQLVESILPAEARSDRPPNLIDVALGLACGPGRGGGRAGALAGRLDRIAKVDCVVSTQDEMKLVGGHVRQANHRGEGSAFGCKQYILGGCLADRLGLA